MPHCLTFLLAGAEINRFFATHDRIHGHLVSARKFCRKAKVFVVFSKPLVSKASACAVWKLQHAYIGKPVSRGNAQQRALREIKEDQGGSKLQHAYIC